jgi:microcystin-dependent protein
MTADTYSSRLGILEMGTGNQNNSWGTSFNNSVTEVIDRAIAGFINHAGQTGGTLDLSTSPPPAGMRLDIDMYHGVLGALTSNLTIIVPALPKTWYWFNATTGNFSVFLQIAGGGSTVEIPQNTGKFIVSAATALFRLDRAEVGNFIYHGGTTAPPGTFACNGASLLRADHPDLFNAIGTTWGAADGTHFTLPLLTDTNRFLRAAGGSLAVGTYQSSQNLAHTHAGATFSGTTSDMNADHSHAGSGTTGTESNFHTHGFTAALVGGGNPGITGSAVVGVSNQSLTTNNNNQLHTHPFSFGTGGVSNGHAHTYNGTTGTIPSSGGTEARPEAAVVLICIKY